MARKHCTAIALLILMPVAGCGWAQSMRAKVADTFGYSSGCCGEKTGSCGCGCDSDAAQPVMTSDRGDTHQVCPAPQPQRLPPTDVSNASTTNSAGAAATK